MSARYTFAVYETEIGSAIQKLILLKLADNANDEGVCWPGMEYLAKHCELSKSAVLRNLKALEEKGFIKVTRRKSQDSKTNQSNVYRLTLPSSSQLPPSSSQPLPPSSSELPESNNNKPNKEPNKSSGNDHSQDVLNIYHDTIEKQMPNWKRCRTITAKRKRMMNKSLLVVRERATEVGLSPLEYLSNLLPAMARDDFFSGWKPSAKYPSGYTSTIDQVLREDNLSTALDRLSGD